MAKRATPRFLAHNPPQGTCTEAPEPPNPTYSSGTRLLSATHMHTATQANLTEGGQPKSDSPPQKFFYIQKVPEEPTLCSGQLEPTWRGAAAGGVLIYTHVGGCGFESRCARAILFVSFWCFGAQVAARAKWRVVRGNTGGNCEFRGWPRVAFFPDFFDACFAV